MDDPSDRTDRVHGEGRCGGGCLDDVRLGAHPAGPGQEGVSHQERAFLSITRLAGVLDETALIAVPNDFSKDIVETRLRGGSAVT